MTVSPHWLLYFSPAPHLSSYIILHIFKNFSDQSMELLFENGKGRVYQSVVSWLSSSVEELQVSGVLAVVNFARAGK